MSMMMNRDLIMLQINKKDTYPFCCCRHNEVWPEFTFHKKYQTWLPVSNKTVYCIWTVKRSKLHAHKKIEVNIACKNFTRSTSDVESQNPWPSI